MSGPVLPVRAEDIAGAAARIADLEYQLALVQRRLTEEMARSEERRRRLEAAEGTILGRGGR